MKRHIIVTIGCLAAVFTLLGCAHTKAVTASTPVVVKIAADGSLAVDGQQCAWAQLADKLKTQQYRKSAGVTLCAAKQTRWSDVTAVQDACNAAGFEIRAMQPASQ
jgi:biopolymer transport protein ExbD